MPSESIVSQHFTTARRVLSTRIRRWGKVVDTGGYTSTNHAVGLQLCVRELAITSPEGDAMAAAILKDVTASGWERKSAFGGASLRCGDRAAGSSAVGAAT